MTDIKKEAARIGITESALRKRIREWGEDEALSTPRMTKAQSGRKARSQSKYRFMLPGSHVFEGDRHD